MNNKIFLKVFSSEVFFAFSRCRIVFIVVFIVVVVLTSWSWSRVSIMKVFRWILLFIRKSGRMLEKEQDPEGLSLLYDTVVYQCPGLLLSFLVMEDNHAQLSTILHTSPGLRLGFSRLEITDSLIASDAKRSYLPDYANHLSPGCWGVGTCDPCFSCTFCVVLLLIVPGYSKSHTAVNAGYLGLGWET